MIYFESGIKNPSKMTNQKQFHKIFPYQIRNSNTVSQDFPYVSINSYNHTYSVD